MMRISLGHRTTNSNTKANNDNIDDNDIISGDNRIRSNCDQMVTQLSD